MGTATVTKNLNKLAYVYKEYTNDNGTSALAEYLASSAPYNEPCAVFDSLTVAKTYIEQQKELNNNQMKIVLQEPDTELTLTAVRNHLATNLNTDPSYGYELGDKWLPYYIENDVKGECFAINTPFLNYIGDNFCVYITLQGSKLSIDDDGFNIDEWLMSGFTTKDIDKLNAKAKQAVNQVISNYVGLNVVKNDMLSMPVPVNSNVIIKYLMDFIQAIITLDGLLRIAWQARRKQDVKEHKA